MRANRPTVDIWAVPDGRARVSQLLFGEAFETSAREGAYSFGRTGCGYEGWVLSAELERSRPASHHVQALASYVYAAPDMKSEVRLRLPYRALVQVNAQEGDFSRLPEGYIFSAHLGTAPVVDFVGEAERFIGVPYLWGGRSSLGIDCSGLAQMALKAAGVEAPRDSGPQSASVGAALAQDAPLQRGDLVFWKGHVGLMRDRETLLHATAFSMSVMVEPLATTIARVAAQGYGGVTAVRRV